MSAIKYINDNGEYINEPSDLSSGRVEYSVRIKPDAKPLGGEKHVWLDTDYEQIYIWHPFSESENIAKTIEKAKARLAETDYISAKAMDKLMVCTSVIDMLTALNYMAAEYKDIIIEREQLRKMINDLETKE